MCLSSFSRGPASSVPWRPNDSIGLSCPALDPAEGLVDLGVEVFHDVRDP